MGGGARYDYPKWVWSPAGGWWANPPQWKRNTAIAFGIVAVVTSFVWQKSNSLQTQYNFNISKKDILKDGKAPSGTSADHGHH